ncbi:MAG: amino acid adenylation domain-containing protein, partial [bacterium]|nr:amino acid adenylation domain-containing protein [bacterium]
MSDLELIKEANKSEGSLKSYNEMEKLDKKNIEDIIALTPMQEGMLFHYLKDSAGTTYFEQLSLSISGQPDSRVFEEAWNFVIRGNEMLRAVFRWEKAGLPVRIILQEHRLKPAYHDFSSETPGNAQTRLEEVKRNDRETVFDLQEVAFRVTLCRVREYKYEMIVSNHHILYDGWSNGIILKEFFRAYHTLHSKKQLSEPPSKTPFKEFVQWYRRQDKRKQRHFWSAYLKGFDSHTQLPLEKRPPHRPKGPGKSTVNLEETIKDKLTTLAGKLKITPASVFYSAWGILLQRYCNSEDVSFGTTVSGRSAPINGIEDMVGLFINTIPLRVRTGGNKNETITDSLYRINENLTGREQYEATPLVDIKETSELGNEPGFFNSIVAVENYPLEKALQVFEEKGNSAFSFDSYSIVEETHYDLTVAITLFDQIRVDFNYNRDLVDPGSIHRLAGHFVNILGGIVTNPVKEITTIEMLTEAEKNTLLYQFNDTSTDYPRDKTIHGLFQEQAGRTPHAMALVYEDLHVTYNELDKAAHQLAQRLVENGVQPGANAIVGIMVKPSMEMITGIFGILNAGAAYLPIRPDTPEERIDFMLRDSAAKVIVTNGLKVKRLDGFMVRKPGESNDLPNPQTNKPTNPQTNLAYIIYTSGSTGKPKGVLTTHYNVTRVVLNTNYIELTANDRVLQWSNYAFDGSVFDIYGALLNGGALVLLREEEITAADRLADVITRQSITIFFVTTAFFNLLVDVRPNVFDNIRKVLFGGERVSLEHTRRALESSGPDKIIHVYGPTETTVYATWYPVNRIDEGASTVPIGKALANTAVYILDKSSRPVPFGVTGEIFIGGSGTARGYLNRPELTGEKFKKKELEFPSILYRTGDLARWLPDGNIEFIGRTDHQVKIRGFRIELGEIESQLIRHENVKEAVVIDRGEQGSEKYLCAYIVPVTAGADRGENNLETGKLQSFLSGPLPGYMIPAFFVVLERFPLTSTGKLDRGALPTPSIGGSKEYSPPRNEVETQLVETWAGVLGIEKEKIGINDDFFALGGHSLKVVLLAARIHRLFNVKMSLTELFERPTIKKISRYIQEARRDRHISVEPSEVKEYYPLSSAQRRLYVLRQMEKMSTGYNLPALLMLEGHVDVGRLEDAFNCLIRRHESFRTSFHIIDGQPVQKVH